LISYLGVPLIVKDEILGVLSFYTKEQHEFSDEEVEFLSTLAGQAAIAIHNSQLYEETRNQAVELEKANKGKDEFLSVVSHELRTPLNVIAGYAEMVRQGMLGEINPEQDRALGKVIDHSKGLLGMIAGILQVTSIEAEAVKVDTKQVVVGHLLDELKSLYDFSLGKDLSLHWDLPSESLSMTTDGEKLKHILQNLINNAIKFTDNGRVTVSARQVPGGKSVEFRVADNGIGIPEEMLPIIFEKFRQADSSESRAYGGVGLGLYIVKRFTEMLGGSVAVESQPGKGSTFSVTIPCEGPQAAKSVSPDGPAHSRRIADISSNVL
jgi:signal transduction histidine kinase